MWECQFVLRHREGCRAWMAVRDEDRVASVTVAEVSFNSST